MSLKLATNALHAGHDVKKTQGTRAVPIYQSTSYVFEDSDQAANLFALTEAGYIYTRLNNPTNDILEQRLAALEGGVAAVATASGTAAIATTFMTLLKSGDHIVASNSLYGGTYNMLSNTLPRFGITTTFVDPDDTENFAKAVEPNTRAFFAESLGNPKLDVIDLKGIIRFKISKELNLNIPYRKCEVNYDAYLNDLNEKKENFGHTEIIMVNFYQKKKNI